MGRRKLNQDLIVETMKSAVVSRNVGYLREVVEEIMVLAGGPKGFAKMLWDAYNDGKCGPSVKSKIVDMLMRGMMVIHPKGDPNDDITGMTAEDIQRETLRIFDGIRSKQTAADPASQADDADATSD